MLIQFSVENYYSIRERQTLSMTASGYFKDLESSNTFDAGIGGDFPRVLRSAVIYGPNAAGKSNLIRAMSFVEFFVVNSAKGAQADEEIQLEPFLLSRESRTQPSEFEITVIQDGVRYQFGFSATKERVLEEWLFAYPDGHKQKWYHRVFDDDVREYRYKFSKLFTGGRRRTDWMEQTRPNALFLSTAMMLNNEQLKPIYDWFSKRLATLTDMDSHSTSAYTTRICLESEENRRRVVDFINMADIDVEDLDIQSELFSPEVLPKDMPSPVREEIMNRMKDTKMHDVGFVHRDPDSGDLVRFNEGDESQGTRGLFAFAGPWIDVIDNGRVLFVDELDTSLHPLVVHQLVRLLNRDRGTAQLIFTTHDTTVMSQKILRRDQIWFVEKGEKKSTRLYPLSDFSVRDQEAVEKGYLDGRYGGIPFMKTVIAYGS